MLGLSGDRSSTAETIRRDTTVQAAVLSVTNCVCPAPVLNQQGLENCLRVLFAHVIAVLLVNSSSVKALSSHGSSAPLTVETLAGERVPPASLLCLYQAPSSSANARGCTTRASQSPAAQDRAQHRTRRSIQARGHEQHALTPPTDRPPQHPAPEFAPPRHALLPPVCRK